MFNRVKRTKLTRATTVDYTQEYPITLTMDGIDQMSRLNARCLPLVNEKLSLFLLYIAYVEINKESTTCLLDTPTRPVYD